MRRLLTVLIISGCLSLCPAADILFDNLAFDSVGADSIASLGTLYDSFSSGGSPVSLTDVEVMLGLLGVPSSSGSTALALYADNGTTPGTFLATIGTISDATLSTTLADYEFVLATPFGLSASTVYWIGLSSSATSQASWSYAGDDSGTGVSGQHFANRNGSDVFLDSGGPYQMEVDGELPEPASLLMMGGALLALGLLRRKSTR